MPSKAPHRDAAYAPHCTSHTQTLRVYAQHGSRSVLVDPCLSMQGKQAGLSAPSRRAKLGWAIMHQIPLPHVCKRGCWPVARKKRVCWRVRTKPYTSTSAAFAGSPSELFRMPALRTFKVEQTHPSDCCFKPQDTRTVQLTPHHNNLAQARPTPASIGCCPCTAARDDANAACCFALGPPAVTPFLPSYLLPTLTSQCISTQCGTQTHSKHFFPPPP